LAEKYLEKYVNKEILFLPWGDGKGEVGLREVQVDLSGSARGGGIETVRYGPLKIEVDKDGNIYIWNEVWGKLDSWEKEVKRIDNPYVHKYVKEKITKGKEIIERYRYAESISLKKTEKKPFLIDKFETSYRYEFIKRKEPTPFAYTYDDKEWIVGVRILDESNKALGEIMYDRYHLKPFTIDKKGNMYLLVDTTQAVGAGPEDWRVEIYKYNKEGKFLAKINLLTDRDWTNSSDGQRDQITIDKEGNIYQFLSKNDGVHILKWEMEQNNED